MVKIIDRDGKEIGDNNHLNGITNVNNVRKVFEGYIKNRDKILEQENLIVNSDQNRPWDIISEACRGVISNNYRVITSEEHLVKPFIFKYKQIGKKTKLYPLGSYYINHLKASLAKTVLANEEIDIDIRVKRAAYILYDYYFHKKDNIKEISFCVRSDIKNIIIYIIDNACNDTYRHIDTVEIVEGLRRKLDAEDLLASVAL